MSSSSDSKLHDLQSETLSAKASGTTDAETMGPAAHDLKLPKIVRFSDIARCGEELWIECEGQLYRLRKTRQGKLILTK